MKDKLHALLFPRYQEKVRAISREARKHKQAADSKDLHIQSMTEWRKKKEDELKHLESYIAGLQKSIDEKPAMADLMREILGSPVNFTDVEADGLPRHFLETGTEKQRQMYVAQLHEISQLEVWPVMLRYHIDLQGNHIVRLSPDDIQSSFARGTINGFSMLRNEVRDGNAEYVDRSRPPDKFDEFSVDLLQKDLEY